MFVRHLIKRDSYFDSIALMAVTADLKRAPGVAAAMVGMSTDFNLESLTRLELLPPSPLEADGKVLVIAVRAETEAQAIAAIALADEQLGARQKATIAPGKERYGTQRAAATALPDAQVVLVSVPGAHAAREAEIALRSGRHVMLFSDNVSVADELRLKDLAIARGLLMMGPDCGTAIVSGVALGFANAVRRGPIGIVGASGTGMQELSTIVHRLGGGISHALGVGGRDLTDELGGRMTRFAVQALADDDATKVLVVVSKLPGKATLGPLLDTLKQLKKPVVAHFMNDDAHTVGNVTLTPSLEAAATRACELVGLRGPANGLAGDVPTGLTLRRPYARGLFSGGTLCKETQRFLLREPRELWSNAPVPGAKRLDDALKSRGHTLVDLGEDEFTRGRAHPMIDPTLRNERILAEWCDPEVGLLLLDVVLGYGAHADMAGEVAAALARAKSQRSDGPMVCVTLCGTDYDPQGYAAQERTLREAGALVFPTNASMASYAATLLARSCT